jgi:hypothetical protein
MLKILYSNTEHLEDNKKTRHSRCNVSSAELQCAISNMYDKCEACQ